MNSATRMALVAAVAYPLGRYRKLRWAVSLAAMAATGRVESPAQMATQGVKKLASSKELGEITETLKGELVEAAVGAATSAATTRLRSLSDQMNDQTDALRRHGSAALKGIGGRGSSAEEGDDSDENDDEGAEEREDNDRRPARHTRSSQGPSAGRRRSGGRGASGGDDPRPGRRASASRGRASSDSDDGEGASRSRRRQDRPGDRSTRSPVRRKG